MSEELTEKQREFCRLVAKGQSGRAAYAAAFGCNEASAASSASRMLKRDNIRKEISRLTAAARELSRQRDARAVLTREQRMEMLSQSAQECRDAGDMKYMVACLAELNRMDGAYEPEKVQVEAVSLSFEGLMDGIIGSGQA